MTVNARALLEPILDVPQPVLVPEIQVVHDQVPLPENIVANDPININLAVGEEPIPFEKVLVPSEQFFFLLFGIFHLYFYLGTMFVDSLLEL